MDALLSAGLVLALIFLFLGMGVWIFVGLLFVSGASLALVAGMDIQRIGTIAANIVYRYSSTWELAAIPMFIWMGEIIFRTDISDRIFRGLTPFVNWLPGRLLHTNVLGCTMFAAVSGSSAATAATVGKITTSELSRRGYDQALSLGSLAGAGSFGLLIPPSIVMIVYGILAEVSISRLFAAGVLPGIMIAFLFSAYIVFRAVMKPEIAPKADTQFDLRQFGAAFVDLLPIISLMVIVLGAIYSGIATPSEAAAVGVFGAIVITVFLRQFSFSMLVRTLLGAVVSSAMICSILVAAAFLSTAMGYLHIPTEIAHAIGELQLSPEMLIVVLTLFYLVLGLFLDGVSIIVMSLPITLPLALQAGIDPVWFGIFLIVTVELGQITPPVGFNLFILQSLTGQPVGRVALYALPFFILMLGAIALLVWFPEIALWLPGVLYD
ncbi:TRAP transporter large permease [Thalassospira alkalitolerans]|uniref:TRAP transporter large permease protein n=1 Tax=Thalassospira alkalitolerans TaxID=1293890 RepID=A0A1Y2LH72_9PROT|nr:TRAP transporter large permease subunit [Thalassospira alkalitolerans]OSQ49383.1 C4-dicarboxylate ABC transporter permease [Thalassospira alkalitolerans]